MTFFRQASKPVSRGDVRPQVLSRLWAVFAFLTFFAFADQAYLTQTHEVTAQLEAAVQGPNTSGTGSHTPGTKHGTSCPLCQSIVSSGTYLAPATIGLTLPVAQYFRAVWPPLALIAPSSGPGHIWRGRAPPVS